jgi:hypothetical protein
MTVVKKNSEIMQKIEIICRRVNRLLISFPLLSAAKRSAPEKATADTHQVMPEEEKEYRDSNFF